VPTCVIYIAVMGSWTDVATSHHDSIHPFCWRSRCNSRGLTNRRMTLSNSLRSRHLCRFYTFTVGLLFPTTREIMLCLMSVCYQRDRYKSKSSVQSSMNFSESTDYDLGINRLNVEHAQPRTKKGSQLPTGLFLIFIYPRSYFFSYHIWRDKPLWGPTVCTSPTASSSHIRVQR